MCFGGGGGGGESRGAAPVTANSPKSTGDGRFHPHSSDNNGGRDYSGPQYGLLAPTTEEAKPKSILGAA